MAPKDMDASTTDLGAALDVLAREVERATRADADFAETAAGVLRAWLAEHRPDPPAAARWLAATETLPPGIDVDADFDDARSTAEAGSPVAVEIRFRSARVTNVHDHPAPGAFAVLAGSVLELRHRFAARVPPSPGAGLSFGRLELEHVDVAAAGDVSPVRAGPAGAHALAHLEKPTVLLVVRASRRSAPRRRYFGRRLAVEAGLDTPLLTRRIRVLNVLAKARHAGYPALVEQLAASPEPYACLLALEQGAWFLPGTAARERLVERAAAVHGAAAEEIARAVAEGARRTRVLELYGRAVDPDHRFLLALLADAPDRETILEAVRRRAPARDPAEALAAWMRGLSERAPTGIPADELHADLLRLSACGREGDALIAALASEYEPEEVQARRSELLERAEALRRSDLLEPLFASR